MNPPKKLRFSADTFQEFESDACSSTNLKSLTERQYAAFWMQRTPLDLTPRFLEHYPLLSPLHRVLYPLPISNNTEPNGRQQRITTITSRLEPSQPYKPIYFTDQSYPSKDTWALARSTMESQIHATTAALFHVDAPLVNTNPNIDHTSILPQSTRPPSLPLSSLSSLFLSCQGRPLSRVLAPKHTQVHSTQTRRTKTGNFSRTSEGSSSSSANGKKMEESVRSIPYPASGKPFIARARRTPRRSDIAWSMVRNETDNEGRTGVQCAGSCLRGGKRKRSGDIGEVRYGGEEGQEHAEGEEYRAEEYKEEEAETQETEEDSVVGSGSDIDEGRNDGHAGYKSVEYDEGDTDSEADGFDGVYGCGVTDELIEQQPARERERKRENNRDGDRRREEHIGVDAIDESTCVGADSILSQSGFSPLRKTQKNTQRKLLESSFSGFHGLSQISVSSDASRFSRPNTQQMPEKFAAHAPWLTRPKPPVAVLRADPLQHVYVQLFAAHLPAITEIKEISISNRLHYLGLLLRTRAVRLVEVIGTITYVGNYQNKQTYILADATGSVTCHAWITSGQYNNNSNNGYGYGHNKGNHAQYGGKNSSSNAQALLFSGNSISGIGCLSGIRSLTSFSQPVHSNVANFPLNCTSTSGQSYVWPVGTLARVRGALRRYRDSWEISVHHMSDVTILQKELHNIRVMALCTSEYINRYDTADDDDNVEGDGVINLNKRSSPDAGAEAREKTHSTPLPRGQSLALSSSHVSEALFQHKRGRMCAEGDVRGSNEGKEDAKENNREGSRACVYLNAEDRASSRDVLQTTALASPSTSTCLVPPSPTSSSSRPSSSSSVTTSTSCSLAPAEQMSQPKHTLLHYLINTPTRIHQHGFRHVAAPVLQAPPSALLSSSVTSASSAPSSSPTIHTGGPLSPPSGLSSASSSLSTNACNQALPHACTTYTTPHPSTASLTSILHGILAEKASYAPLLALLLCERITLAQARVALAGNTHPEERFEIGISHPTDTSRKNPISDPKIITPPTRVLKDPHSLNTNVSASVAGIPGLVEGVDAHTAIRSARRRIFRREQLQKVNEHAQMTAPRDVHIPNTSPRHRADGSSVPGCNTAGYGISSCSSTNYDVHDRQLDAEGDGKRVDKANIATVESSALSNMGKWGEVGLPFPSVYFQRSELVSYIAKQRTNTHTHTSTTPTPTGRVHATNTHPDGGSPGSARDGVTTEKSDVAGVLFGLCAAGCTLCERCGCCSGCGSEGTRPRHSAFQHARSPHSPAVTSTAQDVPAGPAAGSLAAHSTAADSGDLAQGNVGESVDGANTSIKWVIPHAIWRPAALPLFHRTSPTSSATPHDGGNGGNEDISDGGDVVEHREMNKQCMSANNPYTHRYTMLNMTLEPVSTNSAATDDTYISSLPTNSHASTLLSPSSHIPSAVSSALSPSSRPSPHAHLSFPSLPSYPVLSVRTLQQDALLCGLAVLYASLSALASSLQAQEKVLEAWMGWEEAQRSVSSGSSRPDAGARVGGGSACGADSYPSQVHPNFPLPSSAAPPSSSSSSSSPMPPPITLPTRDLAILMTLMHTHQHASCLSCFLRSLATVVHVPTHTTRTNHYQRTQKDQFVALLSSAMSTQTTLSVTDKGVYTKLLLKLPPPNHTNTSNTSTNTADFAAIAGMTHVSSSAHAMGGVLRLPIPVINILQGALETMRITGVATTMGISRIPEKSTVFTGNFFGTRCEGGKVLTPQASKEDKCMANACSHAYTLEHARVHCSTFSESHTPSVDNDMSLKITENGVISRNTSCFGCGVGSGRRRQCDCGGRLRYFSLPRDVILNRVRAYLQESAVRSVFAAALRGSVSHMMPIEENVWSSSSSTSSTSSAVSSSSSHLHLRVTDAAGHIAAYILTYLHDKYTSLQTYPPVDAHARAHVLHDFAQCLHRRMASTCAWGKQWVQTCFPHFGNASSSEQTDYSSENAFKSGVCVPAGLCATRSRSLLGVFTLDTPPCLPQRTSAANLFPASTTKSTDPNTHTKTHMNDTSITSTSGSASALPSTTGSCAVTSADTSLSQAEGAGAAEALATLGNTSGVDSVVGVDSVGNLDAITVTGDTSDVGSVDGLRRLDSMDNFGSTDSLCDVGGVNTVSRVTSLLNTDITVFANGSTRDTSETEKYDQGKASLGKVFFPNVGFRSSLAPPPTFSPHVPRPTLPSRPRLPPSSGGASTPPISSPCSRSCPLPASTASVSTTLAPCDTSSTNAPSSTTPLSTAPKRKTSRLGKKLAQLKQSFAHILADADTSNTRADPIYVADTHEDAGITHKHVNTTDANATHVSDLYTVTAVASENVNDKRTFTVTCVGTSNGYTAANNSLPARSAGAGDMSGRNVLSSSVDILTTTGYHTHTAAPHRTHTTNSPRETHTTTISPLRERIAAPASASKKDVVVHVDILSPLPDARQYDVDTYTPMFGVYASLLWYTCDHISSVLTRTRRISLVSPGGAGTPDAADALHSDATAARYCGNGSAICERLAELERMYADACRQLQHLPLSSTSTAISSPQSSTMPMVLPFVASDVHTAVDEHGMLLATKSMVTAPISVAVWCKTRIHTLQTCLRRCIPQCIDSVGQLVSTQCCISPQNRYKQQGRAPSHEPFAFRRPCGSEGTILPYNHHTHDGPCQHEDTYDQVQSAGAIVSSLHPPFFLHNIAHSSLTCADLEKIPMPTCSSDCRVIYYPHCDPLCRARESEIYTSLMEKYGYADVYLFLHALESLIMAGKVLCVDGEYIYNPFSDHEA